MKFLNSSQIQAVCEDLLISDKCSSVENRPIFHYEKKGQNPNGKRILVFGQIHGDEGDSGELALLWTERLLKINPQNSWRIIPRLNPDGSLLNTRTNKNGIDLNRNFPTRDWHLLALKEWEAKTKKNPRRFPGHTSGSEPETKCSINHVEDFKPDIVVAIHTPYGVLDYDGPKDKKIHSSFLPWKSLGTFPGSKGRYLWVERGVPVLTIELRENSLENHLRHFIQLQDQMSYLAKD